MNQEAQRLTAANARTAHWRRWSPYLSERQWVMVREDYSPYGTAWDFFPHDHARSRAYCWGEDGLASISDNHQWLCFALALWNGRDAILKERLFGLTGSEDNHTGVFDDERYFDVLVDYAKASPNDLLVRLTVSNRGPQTATLHLLPTLWYRNTWFWDHHGTRPTLRAGQRTISQAPPAKPVA
jgi:hypothetical protein